MSKLDDDATRARMNLTDIAAQQMPTTLIGEAGWLQLLEALKDRLAGYAYREITAKQENGKLRLIALRDDAIPDLVERCPEFTRQTRNVIPWKARRR